MKSNLIITGYIILATAVNGLTQPVDRPMNHFIADQATRGVQYQLVVESPNDDAITLKKKLKSQLSSSNSLSGINYDSNSCTGNIDKVYPSYYNGNKELTGYFQIDVKPGKYRITITDMTLKGSIFDDQITDVVLNDNKSEWGTMAYNVLPDLDATFSKLFSVNNNNNNNW